MRDIAKFCVFAILIGVLLGGCGDIDSYLTTRSERQALYTAYVRPRCLSSSEIDEGRGDVTSWWLRSPGDSQFDGMYYNPFDDGFHSGLHDSRSSGVQDDVRPALWIITK